MKTLPCLILVSGLLASGAANADGIDKNKCRCVANGTTYGQGEVVCLSPKSSPFTARCEMNLNNTTWTKLADGCDALSSLESRANGFDVAGLQLPAGLMSAPAPLPLPLPSGHTPARP